jgi:hypothetical protein
LTAYLRKEIQRELRATTAAKVRLDNATDSLLVERNRWVSFLHNRTLSLLHALCGRSPLMMVHSVFSLLNN